MYLIRNLEPNHGNYGFYVEYSPIWANIVAASNIDESWVQVRIDEYSKNWLRKCGLSERSEVRFRWGEWGLEHVSLSYVTVATLSMSSGLGSILGGPILAPSEMECWGQAQFFLILFSYVSESVVLFAS